VLQCNMNLAATRRNSDDGAVTDDRSELLWDVVSDRLSSQADNVSALNGRAKDFIGLGTLTGTIAGAIGNDKFFSWDKAALTVPFALLLTVGIVLAVGAGLLVLRPRIWYLSPEPKDLYETIRTNPNWSADNLKASIANGFVHSDVVVDGKSALEFNDDQIGEMRILVIIQVVGLALLAIAGVILGWQAVG
jgi:hypothetical protein